MKQWPTMALLAMGLWLGWAASASCGWPCRPLYFYAAPGGLPVGGVGGPVFAIPTSAPPSATPASATPTKPSRAPAVHESRSRNGSGNSAVNGSMVESGQYRAGFWNVTGRDLNLIVNGQQRLLPRNRAVTLAVGRQFSWQLDNHPPQQVQVPAGQETIEIVLRP